MGRSQNINFSEENKGRGLFYGVIAVAVFIIMGVGATFAYFTATTSSADTSVQTGSTTLQLKYISYEGAWNNMDLIPADTAVVEYSFEYQNDTTLNTEKEDYETFKNNTLCKDDYGNSICSVYVFQVENSANSPQQVSLDILSNVNTFASLNAMAYEIAAPTADDTTNYENYFPQLPEGGEGEATFKNPLNGLNDPIFASTEIMGEEGMESLPEGVITVRDGDGAFINTDSFEAVYVNRLGVKKTLLKYNDLGAVKPSVDRLIKSPDNLDDRTTRLADNIEIPGNDGIKTFAIVLYIKNENRDQTESDAAKTFAGQVIVGSGDGTTGVSGSISVATSDNLQSNQGATQEPEDQEGENGSEPGTGA